MFETVLRLFAPFAFLIGKYRGTKNKPRKTKFFVAFVYEPFFVCELNEMFLHFSVRHSKKLKNQTRETWK